MKKYELTPEHTAELKPWADKWIRNAMSTKAMDEEDRAKTRIAIKGLYQAANLVPPPDERIVFVASPFIMRFAGGFAAAIWYLRKNKKPTQAATEAATRAATRDATWDATRDATRAATAKNENWYSYPSNVMAKLSSALGLAEFGLSCAANAYHMWQGGNQWSAWVSFLSFFRHIAKLSLDYSKWDHYEMATIHSGPRIMHAEFCIVSDRPSMLLVDQNNRPHCMDGPFCQWRDGSSLFSIHGVRMPEWIVMTKPEDLDVNEIMKIPNADVRLMAIKKFGAHNMLEQLGGKSISKKGDEYELFEVNLEGEKEKLLKMKNPSEDKIHYEWVTPEITTVNEALAYRRNRKTFFEPIFKT